MWCDKCSAPGVEKIFSTFTYWYCEKCRVEIGGKAKTASSHCDCASEWAGNALLHKGYCSSHKKDTLTREAVEAAMAKAIKATCGVCGYNHTGGCIQATDLGCPWCGSKDTSHDCKPYHAYMDALGEAQAPFFKEIL